MQAGTALLGCSLQDTTTYLFGSSLLEQQAVTALLECSLQDATTCLFGSSRGTTLLECSFHHTYDATSYLFGSSNQILWVLYIRKDLEVRTN